MYDALSRACKGSHVALCKCPCGPQSTALGSDTELTPSTVNASQHVHVLGVHLSLDLSLDKHVSSVSATCFYHLRQLRLIQRSLDADSAATLVLAFVTSHVDYCNAILDAAPKDNNRQATTSVKRCCMSHQ